MHRLGEASASEGAAGAFGFGAGTIAGFSYRVGFAIPIDLTYYFVCE